MIDTERLKGAANYGQKQKRKTYSKAARRGIVGSLGWLGLRKLPKESPTDVPL